MTPALLRFQPLSRHVKAILLPSCLLSRVYYGDFVAILPLLLLYELDFAVIRLSIRPYLTFHTIRVLPAFRLASMHLSFDFHLFFHVSA